MKAEHGIKRAGRFVQAGEAVDGRGSEDEKPAGGAYRSPV